MTVFRVVLCALAGVVGCNGESEGTTPVDLDLDLETTDSGSTGFGIDPAAVGITLDSAIDEKGNLVPFTFTDGGAKEAPQVLLTFATVGALKVGDPDGFCVALGVIDVADGAPLPREEHWATPSGEVLHQAYSFTIRVDPALSDCPSRVDPTIWGEEASDLLGPWDGATIGYGLAAQGTSPDLAAAVGTAVTGDSVLQHYVAVADIYGVFEGFASSIGVTAEFDAATSSLVFDPDLPNVLLSKSVDNVDPKTPITSAYVQSLPVFYLNLDFLPSDLAR